MNNDPKNCPKRMDAAIRLLDFHRTCLNTRPHGAEIPWGHRNREQVEKDIDQLTRAIALLKAHESMCECGIMPNDGNAAVNDLERSLATHREMLVAFQGSPKGEYHAKCIREIEEALAKLKAP